MNFIPVSSFEEQELQLRGSGYLFLEIKIEIEPGQTKPVVESNTTATVSCKPADQCTGSKEAHSLFISPLYLH